ncbi:PelA/Pel-15E family pectate lyase [Anseongella ginsenosidimutans]|uniref:PelA/Pel-15E family pectate lyase n=1 Tax=Anseongella ginsenosidimutans TaxID=496056 RepID=A0A4V2UT83_9SPHI|nr:PelA/Pel-15E family pectate lyase [Anseongella ginsenosidimutans]
MNAAAKIFNLVLLIAAGATTASAQNATEIRPGGYLEMSWKQVAAKMPSKWYSTEEAKLAAENVLLAQKDIGGWAKNKDYHKLSKTEADELIKQKSEIGATFDNGATIRELKFLALMYSHVKDERYKKAVARGLDYIFLAQYDNGGWPQFYPVRPGTPYSGHITYNDDSMVNIMSFLRDVYSDHEGFASLKLPEKLKQKAKISFNKGIECILNTQIIVNGKPTVWCAQHDKETMVPANARSYELASFSGSESVDIALLLMSIERPSDRIIKAVDGAVDWFTAHQIEDTRLKETDKNGKEDLVVIHVRNAPPLWARFYDLETGEPFFCDRDGIKRESLAEIGYERRNGYSWYTDAPQKLLKKYPVWKAQQSSPKDL